jgi:hypothetical protein
MNAATAKGAAIVAVNPARMDKAMANVRPVRMDKDNPAAIARKWVVSKAALAVVVLVAHAVGRAAAARVAAVVAVAAGHNFGC